MALDGGSSRGHQSRERRRGTDEHGAHDGLTQPGHPGKMLGPGSHEHPADTDDDGREQESDQADGQGQFHVTGTVAYAGEDARRRVT